MKPMKAAYENIILEEAEAYLPVIGIWTGHVTTWKTGCDLL